jgi:branched-chain amino acid transport system ATP-binding protein
VKIFEAKNVFKNFGGLQATSDLSFDIHRGEFLGIIGPNGSGKTTLFNLMTNFIAPSGGNMWWKGEKIAGLRPDALARKGIVRTFQITRVFPRLSIYQNLVIGHHLQHGGFKDPRRTISESIESLLAFFNFQDRRDVLADSLAYGDRKKLSVALALSCRPEMLLLDEPAAGLNETETEEMAGVLRRIRSQGITQVLIEHDMKFVMGLCDRIICLNSGKKIAEGTPQEIQRNDEVIKVYLGEGGMC